MGSWFDSVSDTRGKEQNPSIPNRSRTYDILATSTKLQETRGSEGHKTSSLRWK